MRHKKNQTCLCIELTTVGSNLWISIDPAGGIIPTLYIGYSHD